MKAPRKNWLSPTLIFYFCILLAATPAFAVWMPPLVDYPNHFARLWLLTQGLGIPELSAMYGIDWSRASFNIGIDIYAVLLEHIFPIGIIGHSLVALAIVLPMLGMGLLHRTLFAGTHWWQIATGTLCFNWTLMAGFLNFNIALGLATLGAVAFCRLHRHLVYCSLATALCGGVIMIIHPFGVFFFVLLLAGLSLGADLNLRKFGDFRSLTQHLWRLLLACGPPSCATMIIIVASPRLPGKGGSIWTDIIWSNESFKAHLFLTLSILQTYSLVLDLSLGLILIGFVIYSWLTSRLFAHNGLLLVAALLVVLTNISPYGVGGTGYINVRFPIMLGMVLATSVRPQIAYDNRTFATALAALLLALRVAFVGSVWQMRQTDYVSLAAALQKVPAGSAVLPLENMPSRYDRRHAPIGRFFGWSRTPDFWNSAALTIIESHSFVPTLFTAAGKQVLYVKEPWQQIAVPEGYPPVVDQINDPASLRNAPYLANWRTRFDYALVVDADIPNEGGSIPDTKAFSLVADEGFARLYKIVR